MSAPLPRRDLLGTHYAPDCAEVLARLAKADMKGWLLFLNKMIHNLQGFGNSLLSRSLLLHGQRHRSWSHHGDHGRVDRPHEEVD